MGTYSLRNTVEDCHSLDANWMTREGIFDGNGMCTGSITWSRVHDGEEAACVGYEVNTSRRWMGLSYRLVRDDESVECPVKLTTTELHWGGTRWWFVCPLTSNGRDCGRRVGKLYLPPGGRHFGCRHCYDLTYESCREAHMYDHLFGLVGTRMGCSGCDVKGILEEGLWNRDLERRRKRNEQRRRRRKAKNWS